MPFFAQQRKHLKSKPRAAVIGFWASQSKVISPGLILYKEGVRPITPLFHYYTVCSLSVVAHSKSRQSYFLAFWWHFNRSIKISIKFGEAGTNSHWFVAKFVIGPCKSLVLVAPPSGRFERNFQGTFQVLLWTYSASFEKMGLTVVELAVLMC